MGYLQKTKSPGEPKMKEKVEFEEPKPELELPGEKTESEIAIRCKCGKLIKLRCTHGILE